MNFLYLAHVTFKDARDVFDLQQRRNVFKIAGYEVN